MANQQDNAKNILNYVNSIKSAIDFYSDDNGNVSIYLSDKARTNVVNFIIDFLTSTEGKEVIIKKVADFIAKGLPALEGAVKIILIEYLATLSSCSVKPICTEKLIREGVYFDLQEIDLFNMLNNAPVINKTSNNVDEPGRYLYFDVDDIKTIPDLVNSRDFDAVLWYAKNAPGTRITWKRDIDVGTEPGIWKLDTGLTLTKVDQTVTYHTHQLVVTRICKEGKDNEGNKAYYTYNNKKAVTIVNDSPIYEDGFSNMTQQDITAYAKQRKQNGILTIEYNAKSSNLTDAEHNQMNINEPMQNLLHVFIGCCSELSQEKDRLRTEINAIHSQLSDLKALKDNIADCQSEIKKVITEYESDTVNDKTNDIKLCYDNIINLDNITKEILTNTQSSIAAIISTYYNISGTKAKIPVLNGREVNSLTVPVSIANTKQSELEYNLKYKTEQLSLASTGSYPNVQSNYYYMHPLIEFNTDAILSMKFFDETVTAAQLINALVGCLEYRDGDLGSNGLFSFNANLSFQEKMLKKELDSIVNKIIEDDEDDDVNDCFFTFDNNKFNELMQASEMNRMGLFTLDGQNAINPVTPSQVMDAINSLASNATKEELATAINDSLTKALALSHKASNDSSDSSDYDIDFNFGVNFDTNFNILEMLIKKLVYVIVVTIFTPKIYMILMFNLKLFDGNEQSFNMLDFIEYCKSMLVEIIKEIKNQVLEYFKDYMMKILQELLSMFSPLMLQEQYTYYKELLASCVECLNIHFNEYDWAQDAVYYADITDPITSTNSEC